MSVVMGARSAINGVYRTIVFLVLQISEEFSILQQQSREIPTLMYIRGHSANYK